MRILLDESLPRKFASELTGHETRTVQKRGWAGRSCRSQSSFSWRSTIASKRCGPWSGRSWKRSKTFDQGSWFESVADAVLQSINISDGGVPKLARATCLVRFGGLEGDRQRDLEHHGGPERAVCLYSLDLIEALRAEGHLIAPGAIGENLTLRGISWDKMTPGSILEIGEVTLEIASYASPCTNIAGSFLDGNVKRVSQKVHPGWSRLYARVLREGIVRAGDLISLPGS